MLLYFPACFNFFDLAKGNNLLTNNSDKTSSNHLSCIDFKSSKMKLFLFTFLGIATLQSMLQNALQSMFQNDLDLLWIPRLVLLFSTSTHKHLLFLTEQNTLPT